MLRCPSCAADAPGGFAFCGRCGIFGRLGAPDLLAETDHWLRGAPC